MTHDNQENRISSTAMIGASDLTLQTVILLVFGLFMFLFGLLQFRIHAGVLPYNPDSTYGLLLVIASVQIITMGKTPFGSLRRTWMLVILGICMAILGTIACFIPGFLSEIVRELVGVIFFTGGITLFLQLVISKEKANQWMRISGILRHLTLACGFVYLMEVLFGLVTLLQGNKTNPYNAIITLIFGICFFYLAWCIQKVSQVYSLQETANLVFGSTGSHNAEEKRRFFLFREVSISTQISFVLLLGVIFLLFAILLVPVNRGIFPFSRDSQFGLLMVIMAIQVLALGKTPVGVYNRSWLLICIGLIIVSIGIYSCIVPGLLTGWMLIPLGTWNLITGSIGLGKLFNPIMHRIRHPPDKPVTYPPIILKLLVTVTFLHLATIFFGVNVIVPGLIPGVAAMAILFFLGLLFLVLAYILVSLPVNERINQIG